MHFIRRSIAAEPVRPQVRNAGLQAHDEAETVLGCLQAAESNRSSGMDRATFIP
jgi:hypothetical protein